MLRDGALTSKSGCCVQGLCCFAINSAVRLFHNVLNMSMRPLTCWRGEGATIDGSAMGHPSSIELHQ